MLTIEQASELLSGIKYIYWGEVVSIDDPFESREIKVRIPDIDKTISNNADLPPCYPALSAFFHFVPNIGERVLVFLDRIYKADKIVNQEKRYYLSVSISQPQNIENDPYYYTANSNETDGWTRRETPISQVPSARGSYPRKNEISFIGRNNADVSLRDNEVIIRAGRHEKDKYEQFNRKNPAFIQLRYGLNNAGKQVNTRTVTKLQQIPADYTIKVTVDSGYRLMIKVLDKKTNSIAEQYTSSYPNETLMVREGKEIIREYQQKYAKWELRVTDDAFQDMPVIYPNNTKIIKVQEKFNEDGEFKEFAGSCVNIVAEKINLISTKGTGNYNVTDPDSQIDEATQLEINSTAQPMVRGNALIEFGNLIKDFVKLHTHPYHGMAVVQDEIVKKIIGFNLDSLIDKNIRLG